MVIFNSIKNDNNNDCITAIIEIMMMMMMMMMMILITMIMIICLVHTEMTPSNFISENFIKMKTRCTCTGSLKKGDTF